LQHRANVARILGFEQLDNIRAQRCVATVCNLASLVVDTRVHHLVREFIGVAVARFGTKKRNLGFFLSVVCSAEFVVLANVNVNTFYVLCDAYLALLQKTPFLTLGGLRALLVVPPLNGIAHGRHVCGLQGCFVEAGAESCST
jgi:hypothetical protein